MSGASTPAPAAAAGTGLDERARALHQRCLVADIHTHALLSVGYLGYDVARPRRRLGRFNPLKNLVNPVTIERALDGGVGLLVFAVYVFGSPFGGYRRKTWRMIERFERLMERYADRAEHARSVADVRRIRAAGKLACMLALEGGHSLERDLGQLEALRHKGVTYLTLTHFVNNELSGAAMHPGRRPGLTALGREVVRACEDLGILVDVTHCSKRAIRDAAALATRPLIYSHTGLRRVAEAERLTSDDELRMVAEQGGIVGQMLSPFFVNGSLRKGSADETVAALEHAIAIAGEGRVCIGSDLCSGLPPLDDVPDVGAYEVLTRAMLRAGWSDDRVAKVWGESFLSLLERVGW